VVPQAAGSWAVTARGGGVSRIFGRASLKWRSYFRGVAAKAEPARFRTGYLCRCRTGTPLIFIGRTQTFPTAAVVFGVRMRSTRISPL